MSETISVCYKISTKARIDDLERSVRALDADSEAIIVYPKHATWNGEIWNGPRTIHVPIRSQSLTTARNRAAEHATGEIIAFMDDDAVPSDGWADAIRDGYQHADAVGGPLYPEYRGHAIDWLPREWHWLIGCGPYYDESGLVPNTYGSNFAVDADAFHAAGGFDESIGMGSGGVGQGAETELARRLRDAGYDAVYYHPDAVVHHVIEEWRGDWMALLTRAYKQGHAKATIGNGERETAFLRGELPDAMKRSPRSAAVSVGLVGAVGAGFIRGKLSGGKA